ncbi:rum1 [Moniliophthora roreri MCA 2997]|nr:rum1 [Moniliophthora roreri MCA 2997]KAI3610467.1 rum1 [Moniliophthora roreri]
MHTSPPNSTRGGTPRRGRSPNVSSPGAAQASSSTLPTEYKNSSTPTFFSCLSIPVEGAIPITEDSKLPAEPTSPDADSKRAPRKSKTDAINALNAHAKNSSTDSDDLQDSGPLAEKYRHAVPIPVSPTLNLSTVKTASPNRRPLPRSNESRPFGLEDCPEFYPSAEEFKDPMAYISSISEKAKEHGICKIVPPEGWTMPFITDTERFRFKTRVQRLNSIEASSRAKLNFLEQLYRYHKQQGNPRVVVPTVNHKPLDLWLLRKEVQKLGGFEAVNKAKKWPDVARILGYRGVPGLATQIKNSYARVILPYEDFCERGRNTPSTPPRSALRKSPHVNTGTPSKLSRLSASASNPGDVSAPSSPLTVTSSPLSEPPDESETKEQTSKLRRSTRQNSQEQNNKGKAPTSLPTPALTPPFFNDKPEPSEQHCEICGKKNRGEEMLLCDGCDCGFHMFCLDPPIDAIPKDQWFCYTCLAGTGGDYGFDEGEEHSLSSFQARDLEFRRAWFQAHPPLPRPDAMDVDTDPRTRNKFGDVIVTENDVENEFWRLVQSPDETVEIEYGADIHSTTHGSAMPTLETHPLDPYSKDPWNLNNIPVLSDSLLRFIKSDISGMTVPWTYVGMAFSTFCWHNEDHYTYSVNFMHWGETKTWYGIPGDDAEKFEAAIRYEAPDLFEAQPDLLFQLVTLMNPKRLVDAGVRVYACNQRAGEFVLTFPKAYHAGFNHGLNFNEAVNFALPDWLSYGRDCVQRYRAFRKLPVFSHDELLITITQQSPSIKTAMWLTENLKEMTDREMENRKKARALGIRETLEEQDRPEDQYQCAICKVFCYLSQITCPCSTKVVCVDHAALLCNRPHDHLSLRKRFSDADLLDTQTKVSERAVVPSVWTAKLHKVLMESPKPALRSLRALLAEGDRIHANYNLRELSTLRKCVVRANEWVEAANSFTRKQPSRKRARRSVKGRNDVVDDAGDKPDKTLSDLYALLQEVERLGFDCPEIANLRQLGQQAEKAVERAKALLRPDAMGEAENEKEKYIQDCNSLIMDYSALNIALPEVAEVEKVVDREQLLVEMHDKLVDGYTPTLVEVRQYLARSRACNISPADHEQLRRLEISERAGSEWESKAQALLAKPVKTIEELDEFIDPHPDTPIDPATAERLASIRSKGKEFEKMARNWLTPDADAPKPRPQEVLKVASRAEKEFSLQVVIQVKAIAQIANELEIRCEQVLKGTYHLRANEDVFQSIVDWKNYALDHLQLFSLPTFEKLDGQLKAHHNWLRSLPWWCNKHQAPHVKPIMDDVLNYTRPEDDRPPDDEYFTCICNSPVRPPPPGVPSDAVQCDHCFARFHGDCAKNGGSCPFCDQHHWNGEIRKERNWHFCYLPHLLVMAPEITKRYSQDWKDLETVIMKVDRLSKVIGHFLAYQSKPANQKSGYIHQVRHFMRKLYKLQFVVSPSPDISFGLDLASLHRILAARPLKPKKKKAKVTFGQDIDPDWTDGTRCICRGRSHYLVNYPTVKCEGCDRLYHAACVFFPLDNQSKQKKFQCPLCCLRKNKLYRYSDVRVQPPASENRHPEVFVNWTEMLDTSSKEIKYISLPKPFRHTLFVELVKYIPAEGGTSPSLATPGPNDRPYSNVRHVMVTPSGQGGSPDASQQSPVPPPPWSRWTTVSTPEMPPSTNHRRLDESSQQPVRKKRKIEEVPMSVDDPHPPMASLLPEPSPTSSSRQRLPPVVDPISHKRETLPKVESAALPPALPPVQSLQTPTLSPSLARLMSPVDQASPRSTYSAAPPRNGNGHHSSHSPQMRANGLGSPPMLGLERESPKLMRETPGPTLPSIRNGFDASPRMRNGHELYNHVARKP